MARIPFTLEAWLKDKSQKVETRDGRTVEILSTNCKVRESQPILAQIRGSKNSYTLEYYYKGGTTEDQNYNLFIVAPEPEFTEFEERLWEIMKSEGSPIGPLEKFTDDDKRVFHTYSDQLLNLAREEFIKQGYVIEKKAFLDAVENISDKHRAEMSVEYSIHCKVKDGTRNAVMNWDEFQKAAQKFIDIGKEEAMKDLPRWKRIRDNGCVDADGDTYTDCLCLLKRGWYQVMSSGTKVGGESRYLSIRDLEKLPEFKEDSHE